jgi:hypothetical protein
MDALVLNCATQFNIVWRVGTFPFLQTSKCRRKNTPRYGSGTIVLKKKTFPQQTLDALPSNDA